MVRSILALVLLAGCTNDMSLDRGEAGAYDVDSSGDAAYLTEDTEDTDEPEESPVCDDAQPEAVTVYLSADDSNSQARATLVRGAIEDGDDVSGAPRVWEFLNYYDFDFTPAEAGSLRIVAQMREIPGEPGSYDLLVAVVSPAVDPDARRPLNLTFSVDTSGSMDGKGLTMAKETMLAIASDLRDGDVVSLVSWDDDTRILLDSEPVDGPDDRDLVGKIEGLSTGGSTNLSAGLNKAYDVAARNYAVGRTNRVVLISDGGANTGVTDEELIARHAEDAEGEGIYLVGVGTGETYGYSDQLMDTVTDVGRGAYLFVDSAAEATHSFTGERLVQNLEIAARDVRLSMTLPPDFVVTEFHGEQISTVEDEVIPQHLAPNDAMLYHMVLADCGEARDGAERFDFSVDWEDPRSGEAHTDVATATIAEMTDAASTQVLKAQAIIAYAEALPGVWDAPANARATYFDEARATIEAAIVARPDDADLAEVRDLFETYARRF
jgi:Ca-activated chloride channel family protein